MGDSRPPLVRVICGPTAAGKTLAAMRLSRLADIAVISADSRQVYRRFDIGTAKPTPEERQAVPHYGIDVLDPTERASAPGSLAKACRRLADAGVNIEALMPTGMEGDHVTVAFITGDPAKARQILTTAGSAAG